MLFDFFSVKETFCLFLSKTSVWCLNIIYINNNSNRTKLVCRVSQGSILSIFKTILLYINMIKYTCKNALPLKFANYTCIWMSYSNLHGLVRELNEELSNFSDWFKINKLTLSIKKTKTIIFVTKNKICSKEAIKITHCGL